jgi:thiosulfate/3-mercaptopyruvate sulfurtransferase
MDEYNISNQDHIIIYGRESVLFTPRTWFTFRSFGHDPAKIHLMQGSLEEWVRAGGEIQEQQTTVPRAKDIIEERNISTSSHFNYIANNSPSFIYSMENVLDTVHNGIDNTKDGEENNYIVIDSRGSSYVKGNIPNSYHIPYSKLMDPNNTLKLKSENELLKVFTEVGLDPCTDNKIICSCGSGVSACTVFLALEQCGRNINEQATFMYDGSWSEWGKESNTPKVK